MVTFKKSVKVGTKVQLEGEYGYRVVSEIHETRHWIKVEGLSGSYQVGHVLKTSNGEVEIFPAIEDKYKYDAYGCVYEFSEFADAWIFIGKLHRVTNASFRKFAMKYKEKNYETAQ